MKNNTHFLPVNWTDGMKIQSSHFQQMEASFTDRLASATKLNTHTNNFGLLPVANNLNWTINNGNIQLLICKAVTSEGFIIRYDSRLMPNLGISLDELPKNVRASDNESYYLVIAVAPYSNQAIGTPDPLEASLRYPFTIPTYSLHFLAESSICSGGLMGHFLPIGKFKIGAESWKEEEHFIPPCCNLEAHPPLLQLFREMGKSLESLEKNCQIVTRKAVSKKQEGRVNSLADSILYFSEKLLYFLLNNTAHYQLILPKQSPIYLVDFFIRFSKIIHAAWTSQKNNHREEMLAYFKDHTGYTPSEMEFETQKIMLTTYQHVDTYSKIKVMKAYIYKMDRLFQKLTELEYIPRERRGIVVGEGEKKAKRPLHNGGFFR